MRIVAVDLPERHIEALVVSTAEDYDIICPLLHICVADAHGRRAAFGAFRADSNGIAVNSVIVESHFVLARKHFQPCVALAVLISAKERITDGDYRFSVQDFTFHIF